MAVRRLAAIADRLRRDRGGSIALLAGLSLVLLLAASAMALDLAQLYIAKSNVQRIADQSAIAAAFAYSQGKDSSTFAQKTASSLGGMNGIASANISAAIVPSPRGDGNNAAMVIVTTQVPLIPFAKAAFHSSALSVTATAYAEIQDAGACFTALKPAGVTGSGGVHLTATGCAVISGGVITADGGATYSAQAFDAVGAISTSNGGSITTTPISGELLSPASKPLDPYNVDGNYNSIFSRLSTVHNLSSNPTYPYITSAPSGAAQTCGSGQALTLPSGSATYGTITINSGCIVVFINGGAGTTTNIAAIYINGWTGTLVFGDGTFNIGGIAIGGTSSVTINDQSSTAVFNIWNGFSTASGSTASVLFNGPANFYIKGGISNYSSGTMTFANTYSSTPSLFYVDGGITVGHGSVVFPNGKYYITSGGINSDSASLTFGNGSFNIGGGIQFSGGGGSITFGSALDSNSIFQVPCPTPTTACTAISTSGSSSLTIGSFPYVDLNGNVNIYGNLTLGAGTYTIYGTLDADASGGGTITADDVSIICSDVISFGQGFSSINVTAPTSLTSATLGSASTIALASLASGSSTVTAGATNTVIVGAIYLPNSDLTLSGAGTITGNGGCSILVAASVTFSGGGNYSTSCNGVSNVTTAGAALVQ